MQCEEIEHLFVASLCGELPAAQRAALASHLAACPACATEWPPLERTWRACDAWADAEPPELLTAAVKGQILRELATERGARGLSRTRLLGGVALGLVLAALALVFLPGRAGFSELSPGLLLSCGTFWAGVFVFTSLLVLRPPSRGVINWRRVGATGLVAMGGALVLTRSCSVITIVESLRTTAWGAGAFERLGISAAYFVVGALYAAVPLLLASAILRHPATPRPLAQGLVTGALLFALMVPAILLQCGPFAAGVVASWLMGTLLGSLVGGPAGSWLVARPAPAST